MPSISLPTALIATAGIGAASSLGAAGIQSGAAKNAAQVQEHMFDVTQQNLQPYIGAGNQSTNELLKLLGLGPAGTPSQSTMLSQTPGYEFQFEQGQKALMDAQSATGGVRGGNTLKALTSYGQGMAGTSYQSILNDYLGLSSLGENAAAGLGNTSAQVGSNIGNAIIGGGNAASAGLVGASNSLSSNFLLSSLLKSGGSGGVGNDDISQYY